LGNSQWKVLNLKVRELAFTGRQFTAKEALERGFVSACYKNKEELMRILLALLTK